MNSAIKVCHEILKIILYICLVNAIAVAYFCGYHFKSVHFHCRFIMMCNFINFLLILTVFIWGWPLATIAVAIAAVITRSFRCRRIYRIHVN